MFGVFPQNYGVALKDKNNKTVITKLQQWTSNNRYMTHISENKNDL